MGWKATHLIFGLILCLTVSCHSSRKMMSRDHIKVVPTHKVLITGFYDWSDLGDPPTFDRCRDNPSCRILAQEGIGPRHFNGPLTTLLRSQIAAQTQINLEFRLLPVTWGSATILTLDKYDQVIHLGLGVYDRFHQILIESGAYNYRDGIDAAGQQRLERIIPNAPKIILPPKAVRHGLQRALNSSLTSPFKLKVIDARRSNTYLCNETYYQALTWLTNHPQKRLKEAYFLHIPHREADDDQPLAQALAQVIISLINHPQLTSQGQE